MAPREADDAPVVSVTTATRPPKGMVHVPAGRFRMGSDDHYPEEAPAHERPVEAFALDMHPVTNAEFRRFVKATGHVTTAELAPEVADTDPGSLVFTPNPAPIPLDDWTRWWRWQPGADWRHPEGPRSTLDGRQLHPVVHVSFEDALAYAAWSGKRLPTETEWEYAARAGRPATTYAWGDDPAPGGRAMANVWEGRFPVGPADLVGTTPVGRYPANPWGLVDLIGNVWEWTDSVWTADHRGTGAQPVAAPCCPGGGRAGGLTEDDRQVIKGGSHLCAPSYCHRYRPPARQGHAVRSTTGHLGFRCARAAASAVG